MHKFKSRFWVKLSDCNNIEFESLPNGSIQRMMKIRLRAKYNFQLMSSVILYETLDKMSGVEEFLNKEVHFTKKGIFLNNELIIGDNLPHVLNRNINHMQFEIGDENVNSYINHVKLKLSYKRTLISIDNTSKKDGGLMTMFSLSDRYLHQLKFKIKYVLSTPTDELIGEYGTVDTLYKHVKEFLKKYQLDKNYKPINHATPAEFFNS